MQNVCPILVSFKDYENWSVDEFRKKTLVSFNVQITSHLGIHLLDENDITENTVKHNVEMLQKDKAVVVLIDEINVLRDELVHTLEDYVLALWLYSPRLIIVLAGRNLVTGWKDFNLRPYKGNNVVELLSFDRDNTKKQIEKLNPHAIHLAPVIYEITLGLPGNNKKILDNAIVNPLQIVENDAVRVCNQELYDAVDVVGRNLSDKKNLATELLPALEALCVLQDFDKEYEMPVLLAAHKTLEGIWNVKRCATLLSILTSIQIGPGKLIDWDKNKNAFAIVEQNRRSLEQELKIRDKKMWEVLHDELPDLQARIQVALFNILQEGDMQIRGFKIRLPLDIQFIFTANPEDYTNRGSIVTPLKDRIESQILTHYPDDISISRKITAQEAGIHKDQQQQVRIPDLAHDLVEQIAFKARKSEYVDQKSGVSARLTITALENLVSTAERRGLIE